MRRMCWVLGAIVLSLFIFEADASITKESFKSLEKTSYSLKVQNCFMELSTYDKENINAHILSVKRDCSSSFIEQVGLFSVLFSTLMADDKLKHIRTIYWGNISENEVRTRLIQGSINSVTWHALLQKTDGDKLNKSVPEVTQVLNSINAYHELKVLLDAMGYEIFVKYTDGVIVKRIDGISNNLVPYDALVWFSIKKKGIKGGGGT